MNISTGLFNEARALQVEDTRELASTGSLPFKKRRFPKLTLSVIKSVEGNEGRGTSKVCDLTASNAEKIAALALVAAAASGNTSLNGDTEKEAPKKHGFSFYEDVTANPSTRQTTTSTCTPLATVMEASDSLSLQVQGIQTTATDATPGKRIHRPPLTSPLPNGCHGRTSRNNSFCRRQPYNGSKFCKSHYLSLIVSGVATDQELKSGIVVKTLDVPETDGAGKGAHEPGLLLPSVHNNQDKRYTGAATEVRCKATTTRGRDCAYCAVNETKYCHLHATFDTHPPPRRGGSSSMATTVKKEGTAATKASKAAFLPGIAKTATSGKADGPKRKSPSMSARRLSTTKNLEKHMAQAPYPLLSTLATDKWFHQKVIVSTGPLTNHVGLVEKWGNGWISVRLPGVGLHNRRSFELYLHPNPDSDNESGSNTVVDRCSTRVEVFDANANSPAAPKTSSVEYLRSPPTPRANFKAVFESSTVHEVTPLTTCRVVGVDQGLPGGEDASRRMSNIMFPTCMTSSLPATVPESPVPVSDKQSKPETSIPNGEVDPQASKFKLNVKLQVEEDSTVPLVQSLLRFQDGRSGRKKLDMLFGTAALERNRRNVHKPDRHEDTEFIGRGAKKRDHNSFVEVDMDEAIKRRRVLTSAITDPSSRSIPVISSSDEESSDVPLNMVAL